MSSDWDDVAAQVHPLLVAPSTVLYRIHRADRDALHFSRSSTGRFDPPPLHVERFATCYFADDPLGAFVEVFGRMHPIAAHLVDERVLTEVGTAPLRLADLTDRRNLGTIGAFPEVSVGVDYEDSQNFARALTDAGFDGVRYTARHDPAMRLVSTAIFDHAARRLEIIKTIPIPGELQRQAMASFGLVVVTATPFA